MLDETMHIVDFLWKNGHKNSYVQIGPENIRIILMFTYKESHTVVIQ